MNTDTVERGTKLSSRMTTLSRITLGLIFCLSGINHFFSLLPMPAMTGSTAAFYDGLRQTGYFFPLLGLVELAAGAMLVAGRRIPLALAIVAPVVLNMAVFHAVLAPQGLGIAIVAVAATIYLARRNRAAFRGMLAARAPGVSAGVRAIEVILGTAFVASGIGGLTGHTPPPSSSSAAAMMNGLAASGYFLPALSAIQVVAGGMLITRRFVGLALFALAPIVVEIVAYRLFVASAAPRMLVVAAIILVALVCLAFAHRPMFASLVRWRAARA